MAAIGELQVNDRCATAEGPGRVVRVFEPLRQTPDQNIGVQLDEGGDTVFYRVSTLDKIPATPSLRDQLIDLAQRKGFKVVSWRTGGALPVTVDVFWRVKPRPPVGRYSDDDWATDPPICVEWANVAQNLIKRYSLDGEEWSTDDPHGVASLRYAFDLVDE